MLDEEDQTAVISLYQQTWVKQQLQGGAVGAQSFVNIRNGGVVQGLDWRAGAALLSLTSQSPEPVALGFWPPQRRKASCKCTLQQSTIGG